jgi:hypothetical protein
MPSLTSQINAMRSSLNITVKRTGRVRPPKLDDPQLKAIGEKMVAEQKARWARSVDAGGQTAKKLSVRYAIIKQAVLHKRSVRDMSMTGATIRNFQLRKATLGTIRAENTTRLERSKALRANSYDQMIGFATSDAKVVFDASQNEFGQWVNKAWIPLDASRRRPSTLNVP